MVVGGGSGIMAGCRRCWVVGVKLWMVVGGGGKIMVGRGWWRRTYAWSWVVVGGGGKIMAGLGWSWVVARFSNTHKSRTASENFCGGLEFGSL